MRFNVPVTNSSGIFKNSRAPEGMLSAGRMLGRAWRETTAVFEDPGIRNGIKFAIAGILSLYFALLLRLDEPSWAVTTAFVLSTPKFVGAIAEKTLLRIVGALAGAVIGYLITGSLQQNPLLFLAAIGGMVAFTTAMFGGTLAPYGFRQTGYTATLVAAQGLLKPDFSWQVGMARCEEIWLGIAVTTVVTTVLWPRYARLEFQTDARRTLSALGEQFALRSAAFLEGAAPLADSDVFGKVGGNLAKLRKMIAFGCFESAAFRQRRPKVDAVVCDLGALSAAISNLGRTLPAESLFRQYIEPQIAAMHQAFLDAIRCLADPSVTDTDRHASVGRAGSCLHAYHDGLRTLRLDGIGYSIPAGESIEHGGYSLSIEEIYGALKRLADLIPEIDAAQSEGFPAIDFKKFTYPNAEWIKSGIRAGIALIASFVLVDWLRPPGGDMLVVGTYLFTAFSLESNDRKGDLGVFTNLIVTTLGCVGFFFFLLVAAPLMSSAAVMCIVLGSALFLVGYLVETTRISSFTSLFALLVIVNLVGINAQHPVSFQTIVSAPMGIILATILSALFRRLLWPSLPQNELRTRMARILSLLESAAAHPQTSMPVSARADLALSVADALDLAQIIGDRQWPAAETARVQSYLRCLARLGGHQMSSLGQIPELLPAEFVSEYLDVTSKLSEEIRSLLARQREAVESAMPPPESVLERNIHDWTARCRLRIKDANIPASQTIAAHGLLYRHEQSADAANESSRLAATLHYSDDFADSSL